MAKTELEMLSEIAEKQGTTLAEVKEAQNEMKAAKKAAEDLTAKVEQLNKDFETKDATIKDLVDEVKELKAKGGRQVQMGSSGRPLTTDHELIVKAIGENKEAIAAGKLELKELGKGMEVKAVAGIRTANLTGTGNNYVSYLDWRPGMEPIGGITHFRDLVRTINSETDFVRFPRANTPIGEGSFGRTAEGATKPQVDRDYTMIDLSLQTMAGYAVVSRQSLRNITFLQEWLPISMREQLEDQEDQNFANALVSAATATQMAVTDTTAVGRITGLIFQSIKNKFNTTAIAVDPSVLADLTLNTVTGAGYNLPNTVRVTETGMVTFLGRPIIPVNWLSGRRILGGNWSKAAIVQSEGLTFRQSDSHASLFTSNEIAFLMERVEELAVFRPDAFFTAVMP